VPHQVTDRTLRLYLGPARYSYGLAEEADEIGVVTGVAVTPAGGDLISCEVTLLEGKGQVTLTGQLGEVMRESAQAAVSYARAKARDLGIEPRFYESQDVHVHVPAGAMPKDGPSAGITMATALVSALTRRPVRRDVAMTGEITLRGRVLEIGGFKEKALAAHRAGLKTFIAPARNRKDLGEIPKDVQRDLKIVFVEHMDEVLPLALSDQRELKVVAGS
jgi:ATP-dependent Lon protease